jgi:hypothetical protein
MSTFVEDRFSSVEEVLRLINEMPLADRETLLGAAIKVLPVESRARILGLGDEFTVITGSFVSFQSEVAVNVQNTNSTSDIADKLVAALIELRRSQQT